MSALDAIKSPQGLMNLVAHELFINGEKRLNYQNDWSQAAKELRQKSENLLYY